MLADLMGGQVEIGALSLPSVQSKIKSGIAQQGNTITMCTPEAAQAFFRTERVKYAALVKKAGLEPQ